MLAEPVAWIVARGTAAQFAAGVLVPVALVLASLLYTDDRALVLLTLINAFAIALVLGASFAESHRRLRRLAANHEEMTTYQGPFALLLRSFVRTEAYQGIGTFVGPDPGAAPMHEEGVAGALEMAMRLRRVRTVALGGANIALPADHGLFWLTSSNDDWERRIERLMLHAGVIFVCPDVSQGVLTELRMLERVAGLDRTVFVMAPAIRSGGYISGDRDQRAKQAAWERIVTELAPAGYRLPDYRAGGSVFRLGADRTVAASAEPSYDTYLTSGLTPERRSRMEALADAVLSLVPGRPEQWPSLAEALAPFGQVRPIHEPPNYFEPPGSGRSQAFVFMQGIGMAIYHHAACAIVLVIMVLWQ